MQRLSAGVSTGTTLVSISKVLRDWEHCKIATDQIVIGGPIPSADSSFSSWYTPDRQEFCRFLLQERGALWQVRSPDFC